MRDARGSVKNTQTSERYHKEQSQPDRLVEMADENRNRELIGETSLIEEDSADECRDLIELADKTLDNSTPDQVASKAPLVIGEEIKKPKEIVESSSKNGSGVKQAYVETSLDDLSYSSSSESEKENQKQERVEGNKKP